MYRSFALAGAIAVLTANTTVLAGPIHEAVRKRDAERVRELALLDPTCLREHEPGRFGYTPLHAAAEYGHLDMTQLLISLGIDVNIRASNKETALITAVGERHIDVANYLVAQGADVGVANDAGETALHLAAIEDLDGVAAVLIQKGASVDAQTTDGNTPLHLAAEFRSKAVAALLLAHRADPTRGNRKGLSPDQVLAQRNAREKTPDDQAIRAMLQQAASTRPASLSRPDRSAGASKGSRTGGAWHRFRVAVGEAPGKFLVSLCALALFSSGYYLIKAVSGWLRRLTKS